MQNNLKKGDPVTIEHLDLKGIVYGLKDDGAMVKICYLNKDGNIMRNNFPIESVNRNKNIAEALLDKLDGAFTSIKADIRGGWIQLIFRSLNEYASEEYQVDTERYGHGY